MVLLEEPPDKILASVSESFSIDSDTAALKRTRDALQVLQNVRTRQLEASRNNFRTLSRKVDIARQSYQEAGAANQKRDHAQKMLDLDREKFALGKRVNESESQAHTLEGQLAKLKDELEAVERDNPLERAVATTDDGTVLQLWVYHSLGIELQEDGTGSFSKAVVRNPTKGDVHVINIEPQRFPPEFYVEYLWKLL